MFDRISLKYLFKKFIKNNNLFLLQFFYYGWKKNPEN